MHRNKRSTVVSTELARYDTDDGIINAALTVLLGRETKGPALSSPEAVRDYLRFALATRERELFCAIFLDAQNRVIALEELFQGTLTQTSVFPREIVKRALRHNAAGVIFAHNHPSGIAEPSRADEALTQTLKHTLALVDTKVLDHFRDRRHGGHELCCERTYLNRAAAVGARPRDRGDFMCLVLFDLPGRAR